MNRIMLPALVLAMGWTVAAEAQQPNPPRVGIGFGAGTILGSTLASHGFQAEIGEAELVVAQEIDMINTVVGSGHVEWHALPNVSVRLHAALGRGTLEASTFREELGDLDGDAFETGFGTVRVAALDAGFSIWPWVPGTVGFAPFLSLGFGTFRYDFGSDEAGEAFFRARGARSQRSLAFGLGADMHVWRALMLRFEAINHLVDSPLRASDFAAADPARSRDFGRGVNNVRLVIGLHAYFPFTRSDGM